MELLLTFIECSIAVLAFSAIVAEFRKRSKKQWNIRLYQGILSHTIQAFVYSCLPFLINRFVKDEFALWAICGTILGLGTFLQGVIVFFIDKGSSLGIRLWLMFISTVVMILQMSFVLGYGHNGLAVYLIGVFWHLFQSIFIIAIFLVDPVDEA